MTPEARKAKWRIYGIAANLLGLLLEEQKGLRELNGYDSEEVDIEHELEEALGHVTKVVLNLAERPNNDMQADS